MGNEAAYKANIQYWQSVAARYQKERDDALHEAELVRKILLAETGKAYDGNDWLREVARTRTRNSVWHRIKSFF